MEKVTLDDAFDAVEEPWSPRLAAQLNGQDLKVATLDGDFIWHSHPDADELFWVIEGSLTIELREEADVALGPGELVVVPAGVEHRPAEADAKVVLFEPTGTVNTGDQAGSEETTTVAELETVTRGRLLGEE